MAAFSSPFPSVLVVGVMIIAGSSQAMAALGGRRSLSDTTTYQSSTIKRNGVEAKQVVTTSSSGGDGGSSSSIIRIQDDADGNVKSEGKAVVEQEGGTRRESATESVGYVRRGDGPYIINSSGGRSEAIGTGGASTNQAWGASVDGPETGPDGTAGHDVQTDGELTLSDGNHIVIASDTPPLLP